MATPGRLTCPRCGENNFDTQAACWKCGAPLRGGSMPSTAPPSVASPSARPEGTPVYVAAPAPSVDPAIAVWCAIALAVFFPYVAVPAGIIFLMLDDKRKAEIGRIALLWGIVSSIVQTLFTFFLMRQSLNQTMVLMKAFGRGMPGASAGASSGDEDPSTPTQPFHLPGEVNLPDSGGKVVFPEVPPGVRP